MVRLGDVDRRRPIAGIGLERDLLWPRARVRDVQERLLGDADEGLPALAPAEERRDDALPDGFRKVLPA
jgi:hypothetical protein